MPRVKQSQLARARGHNEMSRSVAARMTRNKMRAGWDTVRAMLTDPKKPWRDAQGRDVLAPERGRARLPLSRGPAVSASAAPMRPGTTRK
jgi:hypothetical protein